MPAQRLLKSIGGLPVRVATDPIRAARARSLRVMRDIYRRATTPLALPPLPQPAGWPR